MRSLSIILFLSCIFSLGAEAQIMAQADTLIAQRKYYSAYKLLDRNDPKNANPEIVIKKADMLVKYYTKNIKLNIFGLKDLDSTEDLLVFRNQPQGSYQMVPFDIEEKLGELIKKTPKNYKLYEALGKFYYEAFTLYGNDWVISDSALFDSIIANLQLASNHKATTMQSESHLGYAYLLKKQHKKAAEHYQQALAMGSKDIDDHYHLSVCLFSAKKHREAIPHAMLALNDFTDSVSIADVSYLLGQLYESLRVFDTSAIYYDKSIHYNGKYDNAYLHLMAISLQQNDTVRAASTAKKFFAVYLDQASLTAIIEVYHEQERITELMSLFSSLKEDYKNDFENLGGINMMIGQFHMMLGEKLSAMKAFEQSRTAFKKIYDKNNEIFQALDDLIKSTKE